MANQDRDEEKHRVQNTLMEHKIFQKPKTNRTRRQKPSTLPITTTTTTSTKIESRIDTGTTIRFRSTTQRSSDDLPSLPMTTIKTISTKIIPFKADLKVEPMNSLNDSSPTFKQASLFPVKNHDNNNSSNSNYSVHFIVFGLLHLIVILVF